MIYELAKAVWELPWAAKLSLLVWAGCGIAISSEIPLLGWFYGFVLGASFVMHLAGHHLREHSRIFISLYEDYQKLQLENEQLKTKLGELEDECK